MFRKKEKWLIYAIIFMGLLVSGFLILRQIQFSYHLKMANLNAGGTLAQPYQNLMLYNESMTKNFFLVFFCFWIILFGTIIYFTHSERFYDSDFIHDRRFLLKSILPGISMILVGVFILAFSLWKFADLKRNIIAKNKSQNFINDSIGTLAQPTDTILIAAPFIKSSAKKSKHVVSFDKNKATHTQKQDAEPNPEPVQKQNTLANNKPQTETPPAEKLWANNVATNSIKYGYYPTRADNKRLQETIANADKDEHGEPKNDNLWSLSLMQKMQNGYNPSDAEMRRYEKVAENNIHN